jgi:hypothetical protein
MAKKIMFSFRISEEERRMIEQIALKLKRNNSDALRYLIFQAASVLSGPKEGGDEKNN